MSLIRNRRLYEITYGTIISAPALSYVLHLQHIFLLVLHQEQPQILCLDTEPERDSEPFLQYAAFAFIARTTSLKSAAYPFLSVRYTH
jgi:hypothetical protein